MFYPRLHIPPLHIIRSCSCFDAMVGCMAVHSEIRIVVGHILLSHELFCFPDDKVAEHEISWLE